MDAIKFSYNWNNKLNNNYFTTIRIKSQKYAKGKHFLIEDITKKIESFETECVLILNYKGCDLPEIICCQDTGYCKDETIKILSKMYPSNFDQLIFSVILLKRIAIDKPLPA